MHYYQSKDVSLISSPPAVGAPPPPALEPLGARVAAMLLNIVTIIIQTYCLTKRWPRWNKLSALPLFSWLNLFLYVGSLMFVISQMMVRYAFDMNAANATCHAAVYICLTFYVWTKLAIYFYFTERSFLVWSKRNSTRATNKLYVFNMVFICGGYIVIVVLTYLYHISYLSESGFCVIGIRQKISFALSSYEMAINVYLTSLFLYPLRNIYSYKTHTSPQLKQMTMRCVIGTLGTLISTGANLFAISALDGEPAWLCLLCCNLDLLFCVIIVHYVTSFRDDKELVTQPSQGYLKPGHESTVTTSIVHDDQARINDPRGITVKVEQMQQFDDVNQGAALDAESSAEKGLALQDEAAPHSAPGSAGSAQRMRADMTSQTSNGQPAESRQSRPVHTVRPSKFLSRMLWYLQ